MTVPEHLFLTVDALLDTESLTVLLVSGRSHHEVAATLDVDFTDRVAPQVDDAPDQTAWAILTVPGGVIALERSGYGDPSPDALEVLSGGGAAAVVRSNVQTRYRFGCARDGEPVFDEDEYWLDAEVDDVPAELRPLFDLAFVGDHDVPDDHPDPFLVGLAMAEVATGLTLAPARVAELVASDLFSARSLVYP